jgi:hypothetical protein
MKKVFICSPFSGSDKSLNIERAQRYCLNAIRKGCAPFAPHLLYPQFLDETPDQRKLGMDAGKQFLLYCDELWVCGTEVTSGMTEEIDLAKTAGIPVITKGDML